MNWTNFDLFSYKSSSRMKTMLNCLKKTKMYSSDNLQYKIDGSCEVENLGWDSNP